MRRIRIIREYKTPIFPYLFVSATTWWVSSTRLISKIIKEEILDFSEHLKTLKTIKNSQRTSKIKITRKYKNTMFTCLFASATNCWVSSTSLISKKSERWDSELFRTSKNFKNDEELAENEQNQNHQKSVPKQCQNIRLGLCRVVEIGGFTLNVSRELMPERGIRGFIQW